MADTRDPRFPKRPDHPDFWLISEVLVAQDAQADQGVQKFDDMVSRYVDLKSLQYASEQQAGMFLQQRGARKLVYGSGEVEVMITAAFLTAFVHGIRFQIRKAEAQRDAAFPWVVDHFRPGLLPGEQGELLGMFTTEEDATAFIHEVVAKRDPEGVEAGNYGINGPSDG
jgi:hypothetical protein